MDKSIVSLVGSVGCVFNYRWKTWVFLHLALIYSLTLDRPRKVKWFKYQLFHCLLLWVLGHGPHSPHASNRTGLGSGSGDLRTRMQLRSRNSWTCYISNLLFILAFGANSKTSGEVTPSTWTRNDSQVLGLGVNSERPRALDLGALRALGLGATPTSISLSPEVPQS